MEIGFNTLDSGGWEEDSTLQEPYAFFTEVKRFSCEISWAVSEDAISDVLNMVKRFQRPAVESDHEQVDFPVLRVMNLKLQKGKLAEKHLEILRNFKAQGLGVNVMKEMGLRADL